MEVIASFIDIGESNMTPRFLAERDAVMRVSQMSRVSSRCCDRVGIVIINSSVLSSFSFKQFFDIHFFMATEQFRSLSMGSCVADGFLKFIGR